MEHTPGPRAPQAEPIADAGSSARTEPGSGAPRAEVLGPGSVLGARYRLVRCIGEGGMGSIWQADHLALDTAVAIKLIRGAQVDDERARTRFLREARAAASLRSPHVVQIFDYGVHGTVPYIAMELLDGASLADHLARCGALDPAQTFAVLSQVARAIAKAHDAGLVHRDLKPDNIFLVAGGGAGEFVAKLLDFGIAKRALDEGTVATNTSIGGILGTPYYMSPEQLVDASSADAQCDLWSFAVIAYECLLGERPFRGSGIAELAVAVLTEPRPVPSTRGEVPAGFDGWFLTATASDPSRRFADVRALVDQLAVALGVESSRSSVALPLVDARATSHAATPVPTKRRSPGAALSWAAAIGGVVLAALALGRSDPAADPQPSGVPDPDPATATTAATITAPPARVPASEPVVPSPLREELDPAVTSSVGTSAGVPSDVRRKPRKRPRERPPVPGTTPQHDVKELEP